MVEDDYFDGYDDYDDYDDGYDDYDDAGYSAPPKKNNSNSNSNKNNNNKKATQQRAPPPHQQKQQPIKKPNNNVSFANKPQGTTATYMVKKPPPGGGTATAKSAATLQSRGGIATPPPGFSTAPPGSSSAKGGIASPPPGFSTAPPPTMTAKLPNTASSDVTQSRTASSTTAPQSQQQVPKPLKIPPILLQDDPNTKPSLTVVILGHVDAGKSTLTGHLLVAAAQKRPTKSNAAASSSSSSPQRTNKPQNLAWLLDEDEQERQHGITMECATKTLFTQNYRLILQDAPGHADYVPNMIAGTSAADAAIAVVDVTDSQNSALLRGQLREHLYLAKGLGVTQLIVALNKMDVLDWDETKYQAMLHPLQNFLFQSAGFAKKKVTFVPISGLQGINVHAKLQAEPCLQLTSWYKGPTLWEAMEQLELPNNNNAQQGSNKNAITGGRRQKLLEKPLRLLITDILQEQGKGVAVRAKVVSGWMAAHLDSKLAVLPLGDPTTLSKMVHVQENLQSTTADTSTSAMASSSSNNNQRSNYGVAGDLIDLVLSNVDVSRLSVGNVVVRSQPPLLAPAQKCRAKIYVLEQVTMPIIRGATAMFHIHSIQVPCFLSTLVQSMSMGHGNKKENQWKQRPRALTKHSQAVVEITLQQPIVMESFDDCRALGRFVLRRSGESIAVGRIEQVL